MVVVESQRYRIRSASSYSSTESVNPQVEVLSPFAIGQFVISAFNKPAD